MPIQTILTDGRVPVKIWTDDVDEKAKAQLTNVARLPFLFKHVSAMPDVHWGMGATVGSVLATKNAIIPAAVGVDMGCGMAAVQTDLPANLVRDNASALRKRIEEEIPVGFQGNIMSTPEVDAWKGWDTWEDHIPDKSYLSKAFTQLGSLGGGNHFIEICFDEEDKVWLMLHSGSRNIGKTTADRHINEAKSLMKRFFIDLPDPDLAYFVEGTSEFQRYISDLLWCQEYAAENRREMMRRLKRIMAEFFPEISFFLEVNCHHNYTEREHHFNENVWITRKGAVRAREGDLGIIPSSMGARSYIVEGLGDAESFHSCAHGAGRKYGRKEAERRFSVEDLERMTEGVECRKDSGVLDEIPSAYKDIDKVMEDQNDLVKVKAVLKQIVCVKG